MKKKAKKELTFLETLHKNMHRYFSIECEYDWDFNEETGKVWVYKDCTGIEIKSNDLHILKQWISKGHLK